MNREQAEKLLAALIFDDLDEASKAELQAYLQTDDELRERLADMRMAVKLTTDAVNEDPAPALSEERFENLKRLGGLKVVKSRVSRVRYVVPVAAVLVFGMIAAGLFMPSLSKVKRYSARRAEGIVWTADEWEGDTDSSRRQAVHKALPLPANKPAEAESDRYASDATRDMQRPVGASGGMMGGSYGGVGMGVYRDALSGSSPAATNGEGAGLALNYRTGRPAATATQPASPPMANSSTAYDRTPPTVSGPQVARDLRGSGGRGVAAGPQPTGLGTTYSWNADGSLRTPATDREEAKTSALRGQATSPLKGASEYETAVPFGFKETTTSAQPGTPTVTESLPKLETRKPESGSDAVAADKNKVPPSGDLPAVGALFRRDTPPAPADKAPLDARPPEVSDVKVWHLTNAQAKTSAELLNNIFSKEAQAARAGTPQQSGGSQMGGRGGRGGGGGMGTTMDMIDAALGSSAATRGNQAVVAAADERTNSVVVRGSPEVLDIIDGMLGELNKRTTETARVDNGSGLQQNAPSSDRDNQATLNQTVGDALHQQQEKAPEKQGGLEGANLLQNARETMIPNSNVPAYPENWRELANKGNSAMVDLNFENAPLDSVLKDLAGKAGLTVVTSGGVPLDGRITVVRRQPVTADEALDLINSTLKDKGLAAVRSGKTIEVTTIQAAKVKNLNVIHVTDLNKDVPEGKDDVMTFVIPVKYVDAQALGRNLSSMLPEQATLEANRDSNALIITDSAPNVRRIMKIIQTLDTRLARVAEIKAWRLTDAQASSTSELLNKIFQKESQTRGGTSNATVVTAADDQTNSVVVRGPAEVLDVIDSLLGDLDKRATRIAYDVPPKVQEPTPTTPATEEDASPLPAGARFKVVPVNPWVMTEKDAQSTFALDVDTASYALCRRYIRGGYLPPLGAVRMEEFVNAFDYAYPQREDATFSVYADGAPSPFAGAGQDVTLLKIAVKARTVGRDQRRPAHLVFVVDTSASMGQPDRLPLVQSALSSLVDKLSEGDRVSVITCAKDAALHLEAVPAKEKDAIRRKIEAIQPAGPTNLLAGLRLGYATARKAFVAGQINQVVLCSDGVANIGQTDANDVLREVAADRKQGITITCVGVGYGAYNDAFLEALADRGDGRYVFLDEGLEAQEALVGHLAATLQTVAKDARIQVQFNPSRVRRYRLIGYENRDIEDKRFRDDTVEAGAVGSGQCATALYEVELTGTSDQERNADIGTVFVRYRNAETSQVEEISRPLAGAIVRKRAVQDDPRFFLAAGAARLAEWLRQSEHVRNTTLADVQRVLDQVSAALPLDRDIKNLAALAHQAENLPRAP